MQCHFGKREQTKVYCKTTYCPYPLSYPGAFQHTLDEWRRIKQQCSEILYQLGLSKLCRLWARASHQPGLISSLACCLWLAFQLWAWQLQPQWVLIPRGPYTHSVFTVCCPIMLANIMYSSPHFLLQWPLLSWCYWDTLDWLNILVIYTLQTEYTMI